MDKLSLLMCIIFHWKQFSFMYYWMQIGAQSKKPECKLKEHKQKSLMGPQLLLWFHFVRSHIALRPWRQFLEKCKRLSGDFHGLWFGEGVRTRSTSWELPVLLEWLFCKCRWGLSDKAGREKGGRASAGLSSEQIQFHSINIDTPLSPANGFNLPSGHWCRWYSLATRIPFSPTYAGHKSRAWLF